MEVLDLIVRASHTKMDALQLINKSIRKYEINKAHPKTRSYHEKTYGGFKPDMH